MRHYIAYHKVREWGEYSIDSEQTEIVHYSGHPKSKLEKMIDQTVWVVSGEKIDGAMVYKLCSTYKVTHLENDEVESTGLYRVVGEGFGFIPQRVISDDSWFAELFREQNRFSFGLNQIKSEVVIQSLEKIRDDYVANSSALNTLQPTILQETEQFKDSNEIQERFAQKVKFAPSREWVNSYFDLVKQVLDTTGLKDDDPRLTMSLSPYKTSWYFPVSINFRYVIALQKKKLDGEVKHFVGLIFASYCRDIPELSRDRHIKESWQFSNLRGEATEPPYFLRFDNLYEVASLLDSSEQVRQCWHDALIAEVNRAKSSTFRKFHQPRVYKLATDKNFRAKILDMAYSESKPILGLLPDEIDEPQQFPEGARKSIQVNAFERNPQARKVCIEHYGTKCEICGMNFESRYGEVGKGFIHVHHLKPLGEIGEEYKVDPINDLRPVCPNCHAMIHMRKPAYSIDEVKAMLKYSED